MAYFGDEYGEFVEKALNEIDSGSRIVPKKRKSTKYSLESRGISYPPKYVLMRAFELKNGEELKKLSGGPPTNDPLKRLGYLIQEHDGVGNTCKFER